MDKYPTLSFPNELDPTVKKEMQSFASQIYPDNPIDVPYSAQMFETRNGMTLTIDPNRDFSSYWYRRDTPNLFTVGVAIQTATIGGVVNNDIYCRIPENRISLGRDVTSGHGGDAAGYYPLRVESIPTSPFILVRKATIVAWTAGGGVLIGFQIQVRLLPVAT